MSYPDFESELRSDLRNWSPEPSTSLRGRIHAALAAAPDRSDPRAAEDEAFSTPTRLRSLANYPRLLAGLAAGLLALVGVRTLTDRPAVIVAPADPAVAWSADLTESAAALESDLFAQADLLAEDARRAAAIFLDRMPSAPWARRTDSR